MDTRVAGNPEVSSKENLLRNRKSKRKSTGYHARAMMPVPENWYLRDHIAKRKELERLKMSCGSIHRRNHRGAFLFAR